MKRDKPEENIIDNFEVELNGVGGSFTLIPVEDAEGQLCIRHDGIVYDGDLHLWEEIESFKIIRKGEVK